MTNFTDIIFSLILLSVLSSLISSRILVLVKVIAFQGLLISLSPFFINEKLSIVNIGFSMLMIGVRAVMIPTFIYFAVKKMAVKKEVEPIVGYHASIFAGLIFIVFATFISNKFHLPEIQCNKLLLPTAITTLLSGMFLLMTRRKAITMIMGYIIMENGIYLTGMTLPETTQHIIEFGILLDILVGVMLMGIVIHNINRTFNDIDTDLLKNLKD
ncbi:MAG: NADH-quinone oxidoreductase subunit K [Desulfobacterales bacterium]|nr:NADH-quinone oxidoreductase subunit K [Desulfobacterales bacterium]